MSSEGARQPALSCVRRLVRWRDVRLRAVSGLLGSGRLPSPITTAVASLASSTAAVATSASISAAATP